jgi:hypothetical protein
MMIMIESFQPRVAEDRASSRVAPIDPWRTIVAAAG